MIDDVCSGNPGESHEDSTQSGNQWWLDLAHALTLTLSPFNQIYRVWFWSSSLGCFLDPRNAWTLILYIYINYIIYNITIYFITFHHISSLHHIFSKLRGCPPWDHRIRTEKPWFWHEATWPLRGTRRTKSSERWSTAARRSPVESQRFFHGPGREWISGWY